MGFIIAVVVGVWAFIIILAVCEWFKLHFNK